MYQLSTPADLDPLISAASGARIVMLGEASHGTHEFYTWRSEITRRLIEEHGFSIIGVEGDWPDCFTLNRWIKHREEGDRATSVLRTFDRWPTWMWGNWEVAALMEWLRQYNGSQGNRVGFYGLDVYSLWDSLQEMQQYIQEEVPEAAGAVEAALRCFEPFGEDEQEYARSTLSGHDCHDRVIQLLKEIRKHGPLPESDPEAAFNAEQNALVAVHAEQYYRTMTGFDGNSWNIRDRHMMETLNRLLEVHGEGAKAIVWAHNTHIGDAKATPMERSGMVNIGGLAREEWGRKNVFLVGFASYVGRVMAGRGWGSPAAVMQAPPARSGSIEATLHNESTADRYYLMNERGAEGIFGGVQPHRAIGVVYHPDRDAFSNYVPSDLRERYDAFVYLDRTRALHPLPAHNDPHKMPETYPFGL